MFITFTPDAESRKGNIRNVMHEKRQKFHLTTKVMAYKYLVIQISNNKNLERLRVIWQLAPDVCYI